ncbi:hypothetical protein FEZ33_02430 [Ruoffia tabacinasalis]|uniref:Uncharacterized protein n=1 Tax=Ruoffia tabacinasalis TaxID=87458 RepID=A0A5R9EFI9_9LACT|nr:hypothetical protein [Ruoffia tabacinasalis]TLQ49094.1 hypothetical protein FEZ33_02430 [Ruoffia tabacinasalis]
MYNKQNFIKGTFFLSLLIFLLGTLITSQKVHAHDIAHDFEHLESTSEFIEARSTTQDYFGDNFTILYDDGSDITPFAIGACPYGNGICDAIKRGAAKVYNSTVKTIEKDFIEATYNITYKEAKEFAQILELEAIAMNESQQDSEGENSPTSYSYDSEQLIKLMNEKYIELVESNYLEKMLINGDLTEMYYLSLESEKDYLVENLELVKEEENKDTIKQNWIFTLIEKKPDNDLKYNDWKVKATIYKSKSINKITYFNLQDKSYYD